MIHRHHTFGTLPGAAFRWGATIALLFGAGTAVAGRLPLDLSSCLNEAKQANAAHDIERERRVLEHAKSLNGEPDDAAEVQRRLAVLDWKYHGRFDEARSRLLHVAENGADTSEAWNALARLEQERENYAAARDAAGRALEAAETESQRRASRLAWARAAVSEAAELRRQGEVGVTKALREAFDDLHSWVRRETGYLPQSRLLLQAAVLLERGDAALLAWRSYYHVALGQPMPNAIAEAGRELERVLKDWKGADMAPADRISLVKALDGSRFFEEAALAARDPRADDVVRRDPGVRELITYADGLRKVRKLTDEHYRQTILGSGNGAEYESRFKAEAAPVLAAMGVTLEPPPSDEEIQKLLGDRFGSTILLGPTAGFRDLHMGHRVIDETRTVEQYGHRAELRFVMLDNMISNGFQSWAWESGDQHGGWVGPNTIWQVRPAYADNALRIWRKFHSDEERSEFEEELVRETSHDENRARKNPHGYLPGLSMRLRKQAVMRLLDRLRGRGLEGKDLRLTFLAEYERAVQESSIFAHEGRHAIDHQGATKLNKPWKPEYYAKLSQVVFTTDPRLALGSIFHSSIGDKTSHGQANLRIMKGLTKWMEKHGAEIDGLETDRPLLPQFDRLTDEQIRVAFQSLDPLAKG